MKNLLLTLGHNSSAILIENGEIKWGYETERVTGVKSDSTFPHKVFDFVGGLIDPDLLYVTHWAPDGNLSGMSAKHWDPHCFGGVPIRTLSVDRTHHDTHMAGAMAYAGSNFPKLGSYGLVVDGFGTFGEHFSIYDLSQLKPRLVKRVHGYGTSLGLWYQYSTAFMGLKMHEDEYKLLGYEVHAPRLLSPSRFKQLNLDAEFAAHHWMESMHASIYGSTYDPLYDIKALENVKFKVFEHLTRVCQTYSLSGSNSFESRCVLAYYVQRVLESVVLSSVKALGASNLVLSGGVFYNVKLNKLLLDMIPGQLCVYPLAGDQGNALGLYAMDHPEFQIPNNLCWGVRKLHDVGHVQGLTVTDPSTAYELVKSTLKRVGYVNLIRGNMEFGPRALCNTSTLAIPTLENVKAINEANERNTVMPMAPVMTRTMYNRRFSHYNRLWRSSRHMICAMEYVSNPIQSELGIAHGYDYPDHHYTGRPQVIQDDDEFMDRLLNELGHPLINTSFNFHGYPIALHMESIIKSHVMQHQRNSNFTTVVIQNDN